MRRLLVMLLPLALLVACGGEDDNDDSAVDDAVATTTAPAVESQGGDVGCGIAVSEISATAGVEFTEPEPPISTGDGYSCTFAAVSGGTGISITTYPTTGVTAFERAQGVFDDAEEATVSGADQAFWSPTLTTLQSVKGEAGAQVMITDLDGVITDPLATATILTTIVLG